MRASHTALSVKVTSESLAQAQKSDRCNQGTCRTGPALAAVVQSVCDRETQGQDSQQHNNNRRYVAYTDINTRSSKKYKDLKGDDHGPVHLDEYTPEIRRCQ
jgi:hypothetical protein